MAGGDTTQVQQRAGFAYLRSSLSLSCILDHLRTQVTMNGRAWDNYDGLFMDVLEEHSSHVPHSSQSPRMNPQMNPQMRPQTGPWIAAATQAALLSRSEMLNNRRRTGLSSRVSSK